MGDLIEMRFIVSWNGHSVGDVVAVSRAHAGLLEAKAVAVRVRKPHDNRKPIDSRHTVTKEK
jgi:hypothetical protein